MRGVVGSGFCLLLKTFCWGYGGFNVVVWMAGFEELGSIKCRFFNGLMIFAVTLEF